MNRSEHAAAEEQPSVGPVPAPSVSLIVCTTGAPGRLADVTQRLSAVLDATDDVEVLLIDNSADGGVTVADERIRVERCALPGLSRARTTASALARGAVLVFTDDDVEFGPEWPTVMAELVLDGSFDAVAAPVRLGPEFDGLRSVLLREWLAEGNLGDEPRLIGAGMAIHRRVLGLGLWDERIGAGRPDFAFGEESLFENMIRAGGGTVGLARDATVIHHPDPSRTTAQHFRRIARQKGLSGAYLGYHWWGESMRMPRLRQARRVLRLLGHRLGRRGRAGIDEDELRLVQSVGEAAGYAMLRGETRLYARAS